MYYSPLRYPGGKRRLSSFMKKVIEINNLKGCCYVEPFAGGAAIALSLLLDNYVSNIIINDIDKSIFSFWKAVLDHTEELIERIEKVELNIETWEEQKKVQVGKAEASTIDLGFSTFYLNRVNRSGILTGGLIGGRGQSGKWKMDARFRKSDLINRIIRISNYREHVKLYNIDAIELLNVITPDLPDSSLLYLDPPYLNKGQKLYVNYYEVDDHRRLAETIQRKSNTRWIITYDNCPEIAGLYKDRRTTDYELFYCAAVKSQGLELMLFSDNVVIPDRMR